MTDDPEAMETRVQRLVAQQADTFHSGKTRPIKARAEMLRALGASIERHQPRILEAMVEDLGRPALESHASEVALPLDELRLALRNIRRWNRPRWRLSSLVTLPALSVTRPTPLGLNLIMSPWNYPFLLTLPPLVSCLAAGNVAIVKPSEISALSSKVLAEIIGEALDESVVAVVEGGATTAQALLKHRFDHIFFTGSPRVGKIVAAAAAAHLTRVTLELGGKSPVIITGNASLDVAVRRTTMGKFFNTGQSCVAPDYALVHASVYDAFIEGMRACIEAFYGADPMSSGDLGRIVNASHFDRLTALIDPDKVVIGGQTDRAARYIAPTVMGDVTLDDAVMNEEIFGPILPVLRYDTLEDACSIVRANPQPLAAYVFTDDRSEERRLIDAFPFGGGALNTALLQYTDPNLPLGGVGQSGYGYSHGYDGFRSFSHRQGLLRAPTSVDLAVRYPPYTPWKTRVLRALLG